MFRDYQYTFVQYEFLTLSSEKKVTSEFNLHANPTALSMPKS